VAQQGGTRCKAAQPGTVIDTLLTTVLASSMSSIAALAVGRSPAVLVSRALKVRRS